MDISSPGFRDKKGEWWPVVVNVLNARRVKQYVRDTEEKPVDLLELAEKGFLTTVSGNVQTMVNTVFFLCYDDVLARFDVAAYDREHAKEYAFEPDLEQQSPMQKAANWFGERIDGTALTAMVEAWEAALVNFIPNPRMRESILRVAEKNRALTDLVIQKTEDAATRQISDGVGVLSGTTPASLE